MDRRTDWEHARWLAGYAPPDDSEWLASGRWSPHGWCQVAESEVRSSYPIPIRIRLEADIFRKKLPVGSQRLFDPVANIRSLLHNYLRTALLPSAFASRPAVTIVDTPLAPA